MSSRMGVVRVLGPSINTLIGTVTVTDCYQINCEKLFREKQKGATLCNKTNSSNQLCLPYR